MRPLATIFIVWFAFTHGVPTYAQSLTEKLLLEDPAVLAQAARDTGDGVRGAILFSQQKLNCTGCHQSQAIDLLGPDLSQIDANLPDAYYVESVLQPSKIIKEGYGSVKVLTNSGQVIVGRMLEDLPNTFRLRESSHTNRIVQLHKEDVEQIVPNSLSTMPTGLADQLDNRQQFLDLIKYLMDIAATGQHAGVASAAGGGEISSRLKGLALIDQLRCVSCHTWKPSHLIPAADAPDLSQVANRIDPSYLIQFIASPQHVKPGTSMPDVLSHLSPSDRESAAHALQGYLFSLTDNSFRQTVHNEEAALRGERLFHSVGCVACHSPRDEHGGELLADDSVPLGELNSKYSIDSLSGFLEDPLATRPAGRMPNMKLSYWEAVDLANYLISSSAPNLVAPSITLPIEAEALLVVRGRDLFKELGCANCHSIDDELKSSQLDLNRLNATPVNQRGCLTTAPERPVQYALSDDQRADIIQALKTISTPLEPAEQILLSLQTFRCLNCHQRDGVGGISDVRDQYFQGDNQNLGPQGRIPPTLTDVGAKLNSKWLRQVLISGRSIRPYMKTRMPQFGTENIQHLVDSLAVTDELPPIVCAEVADPKEARKIGTELVGQNGVNCVACHTYQYQPAQTMPAVDLTEMAERLQRTWFEHYMRRPQALSPATVMPSFWPGGKAIRKEILNGDSDQQIATIWEYLLDGRQARMPQGLDIKPIELFASDEAVMLRRSYQGIGKRGIGVGLPGDVNFAFDAEQMRLAMIWRGSFADTSSVWRGQGSGTVRPLSREVLRFAAGPDLDDAVKPWPVDDGRPPLHQFTGYELDEWQRPTFTYVFDGIQVSDATLNAKLASGIVGLKRTVSLRSTHSRSCVNFRVASGQKVEQLDQQTFRIDDRLKIRLDQVYTTRLLDVHDSQLVMLPLALNAGETKIVIEYQW